MFKGYDGMDSSASCVTLDGERYYRTGDLGEARVKSVNRGVERVMATAVVEGVMDEDAESDN